MLKERVKELSTFGEVVSGSEIERKIVNKIKKYFDIKKVDYNVYPIRVYSWAVKEIEVECEKSGKINTNEIILLPYSLSHDIETENYCILEFNDIYETPFLYNFNYKKCDIIIFTKDNIKRKNIMIYGHELSRKPSHPPPVPAYYATKQLISNFQGKCRFYAKVVINPNALGYILEAIIPSHDDENIISISTHHDCWFYGEHSSKIGIALVTSIEPKSKYETRIYSFTATETANKAFATIYWSYGSYEYLSKMNEKRGKILLNINIHNVFSNYELIAPTGLCENFSNININCKKGINPYSDSINFIKNGIPSIDISSSNKLEKSSLDIINEGENYEDLLQILNNLILNIKDIKINSKEVLIDLKQIQKNLPLRIKSYLNNFYDIIENLNIYKKLLRNYGIIFYEKEMKIKISLFHKLIGLLEAIKGNRVMIEDIELLENTCFSAECNRFYNMYLNEVVKEVEDEYLSSLLLDLKEFL